MTYYWERFAPSRLPPGDQLAALRRGANGEPGAVPSMWPFLSLDADGGTDDGGRASTLLVAEHHALVLFAFHQQSQPSFVQRQGVRMSQQLRRLHATGRYSQGAVDRRFYAAVSASEVTQVVHHLRGLVRQLRSLTGATGFDYTRLASDLLDWQTPEHQSRVRRSWGLAYHRQTPDGDDDLSPAPTSFDQPTSTPEGAR